MAKASKADRAEAVDKQSVINLVNGASETPTERLVKKHLPAWVISGGLHVGLALAALALTVLFPTVKASPNRDETPVTVDDRKDEAQQPDLTKDTMGLDSTVETTIDTTTREEKVTVEADVTTADPVGMPDTNATAVTDATRDIGRPSENPIDSGIDLTTPGIGGAFGAGGLSGLAMNSSAMAGRSAATRDKMAAKNGGSTESELAVGRGLVWLSKQQKADGSWVYDGTHKDEVIAATGMALLPFLAAGQTHKISKEPKDNVYREKVLAGINYLLRMQKPDGSFKGAGSMYAHAIGTIALCEAFGMTSDKVLLQKPLQAAINFIVAAQGPNGSWGYQAKSNGDTSIVGWQLQALQSAKLCKDLVVDKKVFEKASKFLDSVAQGAQKATYGYASPGAGTTTTAVALLCRYYVDGWGAQNPGMNAGVEFLNVTLAPAMTIAAGKPTDKFDMYYFYYATQVMHFFEGDTWTKWNTAMRDALIKFQVVDTSKQGTLGSWDPDKGPHMGAGCGRLGTTCTCLLTLEVYYRHIPLYRRDNAGMKELDRGK